MRLFLLIMAGVALIVTGCVTGCATSGISVSPEAGAMLEQTAGELAGYGVGKYRPEVIDPLIEYGEKVISQDVPGDFKEGLQRFVDYAGSKIDDVMLQHQFFRFTRLFEIELTPDLPVSPERMEYVRERLADFCLGLRMAR